MNGYRGLCVEGLRKSTENGSRTVTLRAKIWTWVLMNASRSDQHVYSYAKAYTQNYDSSSVSEVATSLLSYYSPLRPGTHSYTGLSMGHLMLHPNTQALGSRTARTYRSLYTSNNNSIKSTVEPRLSNDSHLEQIKSQPTFRRNVSPTACHLFSLWFLARLILRPLKMEAICSSETSVNFKRATQRYIPEDRSFYNHCCENLKSFIIFNFTVILSVRLTQGRWDEWNM
jgi:hypothetical protein